MALVVRCERPIPMRMGSFQKIELYLSSKRGFTIVELIIAIIIIAIISAIAYPVVIKAKETAQITECLSNMREMGAGLHMYLEDYDDRFPSAVPWGAPNYWEEQGQVTIQQLLTPYVRSGMVKENIDGKDVYTRPGVFACPSDVGLPDRYGEMLGVPPAQTIWKHTGCSYEYYASDQEDVLNRDVPWTGLSPEIYFGTQLQRVGAPLSAVLYVSRKAVLSDTYFWHVGDRVPDGRVAWRNTLFADGHAERVRGLHHLEARLQQLKHWNPYSN